MSSYIKFVEKNIRTAWVKEWTAEFLKGLSALFTKETIENYCQAKKAEFESECQKRTKNKDSETGWQNSAATNMSQIRNAIKAWQETTKLDESNSYPQQTKEGIVQQHLALLTMNYPSDFHKERMQPTNEKKAEQRSNLEPIQCVDEYTQKIDELLQSADHRELTVGLIAATGRRPSEIWVTAQFVQVGQFEVEFTGQIKNKGEEREAYKTYTLVESFKVVDALARLRRMPEIKELKKQTLAEVDSGRNNKMNAKVKEYFSSLINPPMGESELSAKNLRASYAAIAIYLFCPWKQSTNQFITERLGHVSDATATNYEDYQVCDKNGKPLTRGAWVERINENMIPSKEGQAGNYRIRMTEACKEYFDDTEFLPYADQISRMQELIRLARIGKSFENGEIVNQVIVTQNVESRQVENTSEGEEMKEVTETAKKPIKVRDLSEVSNADLFGSNAPNTGLEKIRRAVQAIKAFNEVQPEKASRWAINTKVLKDLTKSRTSVVENYLNSDEGRINVTDYNLQHGFTYQHNRGKGNITDFVKLV
ncbi:protelomerase family protein [Nostoc parmelioides]|uniref:Telomere resolvase ResT/TelK catalytic domain-containing protein n=1 Tax=Nostoc parmelioides FACHB-3921 TaxID=2692909 RepID=A0ABR8BND3_9NOSO|nr:protelomerase family protein [Nostoc parmelioides]MBD2255643.1 hypothetical protein [Nostoc parmelioides FACHB-3921]